MQLSISNLSRRLPYKWIVVLVVTFGAFMSTLDVTVINNALPSLQHAFATDLHTLQWIVTAYTLTQGVVTPTTAFFASRLSTKRFYLIALALSSVLATIVGGRVVDRIGPRVVLFPGLVLLGLSIWQLAEATLTTSSSWLVPIFAVRGLGIGCLIQPLTVSALSQVQPREYTQASSLTTVVRLVFTSLGFAILATFVQSRASTHLSELVRQARPQSPAAFALFHQQGLSSAVQDAFWLACAALVLAFIVVCFIRTQKAVASQ